jgi:tRNA(fMet)-specific endonuclease VapC
MQYLLDTDIVSFFLRGRLASAERLIDAIGSRVAGISACTRGEILKGIHDKPEATRIAERVWQFLTVVETLPWDSAAADVYGRVAAQTKGKDQTIGRFDEMIAAHALSLNRIVVTNNLRHFERIPDLPIMVWK